MKFAILGYGFMGGAHLAALQRIDGVEVKAVASRTRPSADAPARGNLDLKSGPLPDSVQWHAEWHDVIADPEIDAVDVCLPTDMHHGVVLAALKAGKHVLCEKPMALDMAACKEMMAVAEECRRVFMVGQVLRFMYPYRHAARFLDEVGHHTITKCVLRRSTGYPQWGGWLTQQERSGGAILDLLSHDLDQAVSWFGAPRSVSAVSIGAVDTMRASLRYGDAFEVVVEGGWLEPEALFSADFEVHAKDLRLTYRDNALTLSKDGESESIEIPDHDPYLDEIAYFVECCRSDTSPTQCLPAESAQAVELSLKLRASRDAGGQEIVWQQ